jgi:outer membrane protein assembly factor BamB
MHGQAPYHSRVNVREAARVLQHWNGFGLGGAVAALLAGMLGITAKAAEGPVWPRFRGPNGSGQSQARGLPTEFGTNRNLAWRIAVPPGNSSPVVAEKRVFLTGFESNRLLTCCLNLQDGHRLWQQSLESARVEKKSPPNDAASSTPVTDGRNLYALFSAFGLVAYSPEGRELWRTPLGPFTQPHGMASSPVLADAAIIVVADQVQDSFIAAFDATTGRQKWRTPRPSFVGGYSTPLVRGDEIVVSGPAELTGYSAKTGERRWLAPKMGVMPIGSPVCDGDYIFANNEAVPPFEALARDMKADRNKDGKITPEEFPDPSFKEAVLAIDRVYGNGDGAIDQSEWDGALHLMRTLNALVAFRIEQSTPGELWRNTRKLADSASLLLYENVLYLVKDGGLLSSVDTQTGEVLRQERLPGLEGRIFASPVAADGKLFVVNEAGKIAVVKAGRDWQLLTLNAVGEKCYATPALVHDTILVRSRNSLWAFRNREPKVNGANLPQ